MKLIEFFKVFTWENMNPLFLKLKKNKKYILPQNITGINLGCGIDSSDGWVGIDAGFSHFLIKKVPKFMAKIVFNKFTMNKNYSFKEYYEKVNSIKFIHHDILFGIPFGDNIVPNIYSSHFLEHLTFDQAKNLLKECFRVLQKDGIIRICVPSLDKIVKEIKEAIVEYDQGKIEDIQKYVTSEHSGYVSSFSHHRKMYNFIELKKSLKTVGFKNIREFQFKKGNIPDVELLDTREGIFVEAVK
jgi:predicted SAM-dependent methyltransferase